MDALVLPVLALVMVGYLAYVLLAWFARDGERALHIAEPDEDDGPPADAS